MTNQIKISTAPAAGANPVIRFRGTQASWESRTVTYGEGTPTARSTMVVDFNFKDIQVLESSEPYPFPIIKITIAYANPQTDRGNSRWAVWSSSGRRLFGRVFELDELNGRDQEWAQLPMKTRLQYANLSEDEKADEMGKYEAAIADKVLSDDAKEQGRKAVEAGWYEVERPGWQIVSIVGMSGNSNGTGDIQAYLATQAEGRKEQDYYMVLVADQKVTPHQDIIADITGGRLVDKLMLLGKITRDPDGTLHSVA